MAARGLRAAGAALCHGVPMPAFRRRVTAAAAAAAVPVALPAAALGACGGAHGARRHASTTGGGSGPPPPLTPDASPSKPDYYGLLGVARGASSDAIKAGFREQAKIHHPDVRAAGRAAAGAGGAAAAGAAAADAAAAVDAELEMFKLINEAYSVLSDPVTRREYDADRFSRAALLRRRNEGWAGGVDSPDLTVPGEYRAWTSSSGSGAGAEAAAGGEAATPSGGGGGGALTQEDAFRASMARASARYHDGLRARASMARVNRAKVSGVVWRREDGRGG